MKSRSQGRVNTSVAVAPITMPTLYSRPLSHKELSTIPIYNFSYIFAHWTVANEWRYGLRNDSQKVQQTNGGLPAALICVLHQVCQSRLICTQVQMHLPLRGNIRSTHGRQNRTGLSHCFLSLFCFFPDLGRRPDCFD